MSVNQEVESIFEQVSIAPPPDAARRVRVDAQSRQIVALDLSDLGLEEIKPAMLEGLSELRRLDLRHNKLTTLPETVWTLPHLEVLYIDAGVAASVDLSRVPPSVQVLVRHGDALVVLDEWTVLRALEQHVGEFVALYSSLDEYEKFCGVVTDGHVTALKIDNCLPITWYVPPRSDFPETISNFKKLKVLIVTSNVVDSLPEAIGNLKNLQYLDMSWNMLDSLPEAIGHLKSLQYLDLSNNQLWSLPESLGNLKNLKELRLHENQLPSLPESIGKLTNLQVLAIEGNQLRSLPESIGNLTNLQVLDLLKNQLRSLPESIGTLTNLQVLDLRDNHLRSLPESIGNLKNLKELRLTENQLQSLPESIGKLRNLKVLWLHLNPLRSLPESIVKLTNLRHLIFSRTPHLTLSEEQEVWLAELEESGCEVR